MLICILQHGQTGGHMVNVLVKILLPWIVEEEHELEGELATTVIQVILDARETQSSHR